MPCNELSSFLIPRVLGTLLVATFNTSPPTFAASRLDPLWEDTFDLGAGGTSLTWATQEGILLSNPALLTQVGLAKARWLGNKTSIFSGTDSIALAQELASGSGQDSSGKTSGEALLDQVFSHPIHLRFSESISFLTSHAGIALFSTTSPDVRAWKAGSLQSGGTPNIIIRNDSAHGLVGSLAGSLLGGRLSLGVTLKELFVQEDEISLDLLDKGTSALLQSKVKEFQSPDSLSRGQGLDVGTLILLRSRIVDLRLGAQVQDLGGTATQKTSGNAGPIYPQILNGGVGMTFHTGYDALHLALDMRDITRVVSGEPDFKRYHLGVKLMLRTYIGVSSGMYHGSPTYGAEIDLFLFRLAGSVYTREFGVSQGFDKRTIYGLSLIAGGTF